MNRASGRQNRLAILFLAVFFSMAAMAQAPDPTAPTIKPETVPVWDPPTLDAFAAMPITDEGRLKPMDTYAGFMLLKLNGKRSCTTGSDSSARTLNPTEWLLDTLFFPERANAFPVFSIDSSEVVVALGVPAHEKKRDRYSYTELTAGRTKLFEQAQQIERIAAAERTRVQGQLLNLAHNVMEYENLTGYLRFARTPIKVPQSTVLTSLYAGKPAVRVSEVLRGIKTLENEFVQRKQAATQGADPELTALAEFLSDLDMVVQNSRALAILPPSDPQSKEWRSVGNLILQSFEEGGVTEDEINLLASLEDTVIARNDFQILQTKINILAEQITTRAKQRGEYRTIPLEVSFYKARYFYRSLIYFLAAFLLVAVSWLTPRNRLANMAAYLFPFWPTGLLAVGIAYRCIIRGRPPVTTLYETILFTTLVAVVLSLFTEWITRKRIALAIGVILGVAGVFLANKYEISEGTDTMPSMVAVLDTNFWLATHVTTISMGYAAGALAGALAHIYVFGKLLGLKKNDAGFYLALTRMVYGIFAFGFVFTFVGTLLGGIWANESWGRFWGWDPKENGALLICLWQLITLHARLGGYIRDYGLHLCAIFCGMIVAFSWMGVNLLGVGLHSYGFTQGAMTYLMIFWIAEAIVIVAGLLARAFQQKVHG